jgi:hypothetical protein
MGNISYRVTRVGRRAKLEYEPDDKGRTLFAIFRSFFWEFAKPKLENLRPSKDPQDLGRSQALERLLADPLRVDAVLLLSLLPFKHLPSFAKLSEASTKRPLPELNVDSDDLIAQFGDALAS